MGVGIIGFYTKKIIFTQKKAIILQYNRGGL